MGIVFRERRHPHFALVLQTKFSAASYRTALPPPVSSVEGLEGLVSRYFLFRTAVSCNVWSVAGFILGHSFFGSVRLPDTLLTGGLVGFLASRKATCQISHKIATPGLLLP
jgi:hypothetical protein